MHRKIKEAGILRDHRPVAAFRRNKNLNVLLVTAKLPSVKLPKQLCSFDVNIVLLCVKEEMDKFLKPIQERPYNKKKLSISFFYPVCDIHTVYERDRQLHADQIPNT